jgi:hypothetical protein
MAVITRIKTLAAAGWSLRKIARELRRDRGAVSPCIKAAGAEPEASIESVGPNPANPPAGISPGRSSLFGPYRERIRKFGVRLNQHLCAGIIMIQPFEGHWI